MSKHDTGGPAMPHNRSLALCEHCAQEQAHPGMTLLDWFAGQVVVGLYAGNAEAIARVAYDRAAALVAEKRKREGE